jgi:hypothetical protein
MENQLLKALTKYNRAEIRRIGENFFVDLISSSTQYEENHLSIVRQLIDILKDFDFDNHGYSTSSDISSWSYRSGELEIKIIAQHQSGYSGLLQAIAMGFIGVTPVQYFGNPRDLINQLEIKMKHLINVQNAQHLGII